jgi:2'-5' RNA ligase
MVRKKLTYILRPTLPRRAIVWFPAFENHKLIDRFRGQNDPQAQSLPPHLTLVFPFHSRLTLDQIAAHAQKVLRAWPCFPIVMHGFWSAQNEFIGIATQVGSDALTEMHDRLYRGPLAEFLRTEFDYTPHITLARANEPTRFDALSVAATSVTRNTFRDVLRSVTIIRETGDNEWIRERDLFLQW